MNSADRIIFTPTGEAPELGTPAEDATFSADGKTATGTVPPTPDVGSHFVSVHEGDPALNLPLFNPLDFAVTLP